MLCKHWLTFPGKGHVGLVENKTGVYFRTRKKLIIELVLQLLNILICSSLVDKKVLMWLTWSVHKVRPSGWEIMSEHPIKCSCDGLLLYDTRLCSLEWLDMAIYIWRIYTPACVKLRQPQGFWNSFRDSCQSVLLYFSNQKRLRPFLKPNLIVEIEIIPWCLTKCFANLELYIFTW